MASNRLKLSSRNYVVTDRPGKSIDLFSMESY